MPVYCLWAPFAASPITPEVDASGGVDMLGHLSRIRGAVPISE